MVVVALIAMGAAMPTDVLAAQAQPRQPAGRQSPRAEDQSSFYKGTVAEVFSPRLFSLRQADGEPGEVLVLAPREIATTKGATVAVTGRLARMGDRVTQSSGISAELRARFTGRRVVVATAVISSTETAESPAEAAIQTAVHEAPQAPASIPTAGHSAPLPLPASMLVEFIQAFAGQTVRIRNARVVGVVAPGVFLIEPATRYLKDMGQRDRMAVFVSGGQLRVNPELLVGSIVELEGTARTVLSVQAARDVEWPSKLNAHALERLEVRGAIVATSVHTAEGTELTERR
jgi:hypothetical protein